MFNKGVVTNSSVIDKGTGIINKDISYVYYISNKQARKALETFGIAHPKYANKNETYETRDVNGKLISINQYELSKVINKRLVEILNVAKKRANSKMPLQYILGYSYFIGQKLKVDENVLIPYEDACIPEVIIVSDILLSSLQIRFLTERIDHENLSVAHTLLCEVRLNIAIASLRACRLHSECEYSIRLACKLECGSDDTLEFCDIHDDMVTWRNDDIGIRILSLDSPTDISYARRSVASARLAKYVRCRNIRQLLLYLIDINSISHHPNILWRAYSGKSVVCKLEQCASHAENIYELFRVFFRAHRPESASYAASHNDEMIVIIVHFVENFFVKILITKAITLSMCEAST